MDSYQPAKPPQPHLREYHEIILNSKTEGISDHEETIETKPNTVNVPSLEVNNEWANSCDENLMATTVHSTSFHDKYVSSKRIMFPGSAGKRPHFLSSCTFILENVELLDLSFSEVLEKSVIFGKSNRNNEVNLKIGSSNTELERALEFALLDMVEEERSEFILNTSQRSGKRVDEDVQTVPCLKCIIDLMKVDSIHESSNIAVNSSYALSGATEEEKYCTALNEKALGVELFQQQRYVDAFYRFAAGAKVLLTSDCYLLKVEEDRRKNILSLFSVLCSNMAECQLRENNPSKAISLCQRALDHDPCNVKALYRQASAFWAVGDVDHADASLCRLFELDPNNQAAKRLASEVQIKIKSYEKEYTYMMKRIFR